jgi:alkylation response protein AidB-like acyl-CoA dehydrogenase
MSFPAYPTTDRQKQLVALAGELADTFGKRANENDWTGVFPYENYQDLKQAGYLTLSVPRDQGGWGADPLEITLAQARLAQGCASTALVVGMHLSALGRFSSLLATPRAEINPTRAEINPTRAEINPARAEINPAPAFFEKLCAAVVHDGALINGAATEPSTGSPSRGSRPATTARRLVDGSWLLSGRKTYTTGSPILHFFLVSSSIEDTALANTGLPPLTTDRGAFLVPHTAPGVHIEETWNSLAMRLSGSHDVVLENVHLPPDALIDAPDTFSPNSQLRLGGWSLPITAVYLGIAEAARNEAIRFARNRRPTSLEKSISSLPHIQEKVAKIELALFQSRAILFGIAEQWSREPTTVPASQLAATKYLINNSAIEVVDLAMRIVGGASLALSLPLQRYYRDVRAGLHHPPMDDVTLLLLSTRAFEEEE